jgi:AbrB family looped-hinge helix DNA binding protein
VTIPKEVRESLRIGPGDRVTFVMRDDGVVELRPETIDLNDLYGVLRHKGRSVTIDRMSRDIAGAVADSFRRRRTE